MDFANERYVKLYTRDTPAWVSFEWQARALLPLLMRKLDRSGRIEWPARIAAPRAIAATVLLPMKVVEVGLRELAEFGSIVLGDGWLEMPNFIEGQEAVQSGAARQSLHKERKAARKEVTRGDAKSREVTPSDSIPSDPIPAIPSDPIQHTGREAPSQKIALVESEPAPREPSVASPEATASPAQEQPANDLPGEESPDMLRACSPTPKRRGKPRAAVDEGFAQAAYEAFGDARQQLTNRRPQALTDTMRDELAKLVAACAPTIEDWRGVVEVRLAMDRRGEGYGSLTWASLTAPKNFERWLLESQKRPGFRARPTGRAPVTSHPTRSEVLDLKALAAKDTP